MTKICVKCKKEWPADTDHFRVNRKYKDGLDRRCKVCVKQYFKNYYRKHKEKWAKNGRLNRLLKKYGMTEVEYNQMFEEQGGVCKICKEFPIDGPTNSGLCVDHDHETGKIRGLLCHKCNGALGILEKHLEAAIRYVKGG